MKKLLIISVVLLAGGYGFGQDSQLSKDFMKDKDGKLGLRAKYVKKVVWGSSWRYEFDGVRISKYFNGMSRKEIIELLGTPNQIIKVRTEDLDGRENSVEPYDVNVDEIEYMISVSNEKCDNGYANGFPSPRPGEDKDYEKEMIKYASIEYYYDCADRNKKDKEEQIVKLQFSFYLGFIGEHGDNTIEYK